MQIKTTNKQNEIFPDPILMIVCECELPTIKSFWLDFEFNSFCRLKGIKRSSPSGKLATTGSKTTNDMDDPKPKKLTAAARKR
jgi:hypothetical protein